MLTESRRGVLPAEKHGPARHSEAQQNRRSSPQASGCPLDREISTGKYVQQVLETQCPRPKKSSSKEAQCFPGRRVSAPPYAGGPARGAAAPLHTHAARRQPRQQPRYLVHVRR